MKRYAKFGYAAPFRFRVIFEKPQGGGAKMTPSPGRRLSRYVCMCLSIKLLLSEMLSFVQQYDVRANSFWMVRAPRNQTR